MYNSLYRTQSQRPETLSGFFFFLLNLLEFDFCRDDGIVIAITFWQWFVEFVFKLLLIGLFARLGSNRQLDHFSSLFVIWFGTSVIPSFYFMACADFRRDLETYGLLKAFWLAVTKESYENQVSRTSRAFWIS